MCKNAKILVFFFLIASPFFKLFSQDAPCLRITATGGAAAVESSSCSTLPAAGPFVLPGNRANFQIYDNPRTLNAVNQLARYKAFWIFGDGNFAFFPHGTLEDDLRTNA